MLGNLIIKKIGSLFNCLRTVYTKYITLPQNRKLASIEGFKIFILIHLINQERLINFIEPISEKELSIIHELLNEINKKDSICILQQIYYEPDNHNLISSISIKINNLAAFNSNINLIKNNDGRIR